LSPTHVEDSGRIGNSIEGSDILFFYVPALVVKPSVKQRAMLIALLWCNYREIAEKGLKYDQDIPHALEVAFIAAVFGRHVSQRELVTWKRLDDDIKPTAEELGESEGKAPHAEAVKESQDIER
jgi:hypothetical protein